MTLKEIQYKRISQLPKHKREELRESYIQLYPLLIEKDALVKINIVNSIPAIGGIELVGGLFCDSFLKKIAPVPIENIFK